MNSELQKPKASLDDPLSMPVLFACVVVGGNDGVEAKLVGWRVAGDYRLCEFLPYTALL